MESESGVPGFDLFVDYVHPNRDGNLLIAAAAYRALFDSGILNGVARDTGFAPPRPSGYGRRSDGQLQVRLFGLYAMNHQYDAAIWTAEHLAELATGQPFTGREMPDVLPDPVRDGYRVFREYQAARREEILGQPSDEERRSRHRDLEPNA